MENNNTEYDTIDIEIPIHLEFFKKYTEAEKIEISLEYLHLKTGVIFRLIQYLAEQASNNDIEVVPFAEYSIALAEIGDSFTHASEIVRLKSRKQVLDISTQPENFSITAQYVSNLINRDDLPKDVQDVLHSWCANHPGGKDA
jgi:hypothetical protein